VDIHVLIMYFYNFFLQKKNMQKVLLLLFHIFWAYVVLCFTLSKRGRLLMINGTYKTLSLRN
jgi:hypothetical protein